MTNTYGTLVNPSQYVEVPDPQDPGQVKRPDAGLVVKVQDGASRADLPDVLTDPYGYLPTFTADDAKSIYISPDGGETWAGPLPSKEAIDGAISGTGSSGGGSVQSSGYVLATANGVTMDGGTDDRPKMQALLDSCYTLGLPIWLGPGTLRMASSTQANLYALVNRGVSVVGVEGETTIRLDGVVADHMWIGADLSTSAIATLTLDAVVGAKTFTVDTSAGFTVGTRVAMRITQNGSDPQETRQGVVATVTAVPDSTHITLDTACEWATNIAAEQAKNHQLVKINALPKDFRISGIRFVGDASTRHAIGIQWAQNIVIERCVGYDVGSGLVNAQWLDNLTIRDCYVEKSGAYGNTSKGRAVSLSNVRNALIENLTVDFCDGPPIYIESYSVNIQFINLLIKNRSTTRSQLYLIFVGYECDTFIRGLTVTGSTSDSVVTYGTGPGQCHIQDATIYGPISGLRSFPLGTASGFFRVFDATGALRTFDLTKVEKSTVRIDLAAGTTQTGWLRDGLHLGYEVYVSPGVTTGMLTFLGIGRTSVGSQPQTWTAGTVRRSTTYVGGALFPMPSAHAQGTKVVTTVASGAALPAGAYVLVTLLSVQYEGYSTVAAEPGTEQADRFGAPATSSSSSGGGTPADGSVTTAKIVNGAVTAGKIGSVDTATSGDVLSWNGSGLEWVPQTGGGSGGSVTLAGLPAGSITVAYKSGTTWPARPTTRTDITVLWVGVDPSPAVVTSGTGGMFVNDLRAVTVS